MKDFFFILFLFIVIVFIFPHGELFQRMVPSGTDAVASIGAMHQVNEWTWAGREEFTEWAARISLAIVCIFSYLLWIYRKNTDKKLAMAFVFVLMLFMVNVYQWFGGVI